MAGYYEEGTYVFQLQALIILLLVLEIDLVNSGAVLFRFGLKPIRIN